LERGAPPPRAVLFDALGTLVELEPPWPRLIDLLHSRFGIEVGWDDAKRAMLAEMTYYKDHHDEGRDAGSLAGLRLRCAGVVKENLPAAAAAVPDQQLVDVLLDSLRFAAYPDVPGTLASLRHLDMKLAIVSNWDCSLPDTLAGLGLEGLVDRVVVSAQAGARKPDPAIFETALNELKVEPERALFVGDSPETDVAGARAAGMRALLLDRNGQSADTEGMDRIFTLADLPGLAAEQLP